MSLIFRINFQFPALRPAGIFFTLRTIGIFCIFYFAYCLYFFVFLPCVLLKKPKESTKGTKSLIYFEEFALFLGEELLLEYICKCYQNREPLEKSMHNKAMRLFKEYILVGGMPQAVLAYKNGKRDFAAADTEKSVDSREKNRTEQY